MATIRAQEAMLDANSTSPVCSGRIVLCLASSGMTTARMSSKALRTVSIGICTAEAMAANIRTVGPQHCVMVTDRGQFARETPVEAMALFMAAMLEQGLTAEEVTRMTHDNPQAILGV